LLLGQVAHVLLREVGLVALIEVWSISCVMHGEKKNMVEVKAKRVPRLLVAVFLYPFNLLE
jgi:hypothetical protein